MGDRFIIYGLTLVSLIIVFGAQIFVSVSYSRYSKIRNSRGITGAAAARYMLDRNGMNDVQVVAVGGKLTDHYDPKSKVVRLSEAVYSDTSVASVAVACHECGHAAQDKEGYALMRLRSALVPVTNIASYLGYFSILLGCLFSFFPLISIGIIAELVILAFQLVTLPVELNASARATAEIRDSNLLIDSEYSSGKKMLTAAALTYVASVLATLIQVFRLIMIFGGRRRN